jgi:phosphohistidine phosphatase
MRHLYLLRHTKATWVDADLPDRDRPLAPRGRKAAAGIADRIREEGIAPELVLCSGALRARQTLAAVLSALDADVEIRIEGALYEAGTAAALARVREVPDSVAAALVIGHNPTLHELALALSGRGDALDRFPPGALASLSFPAPWAELADGGAELEGFFLPRDRREPD